MAFTPPQDMIDLACKHKSIWVDFTCGCSVSAEQGPVFLKCLLLALIGACLRALASMLQTCSQTSLSRTELNTLIWRLRLKMNIETCLETARTGARSIFLDFDGFVVQFSTNLMLCSRAQRLPSAFFDK